jgi:SAM-dependent methyltransferase
MRKVRSSWAGRKVYDWKNYLAPARPSPSELRVIEEYLKRLTGKTDRVRVLILGSTAEFRSLCHRYGVEVALAEFSRKHYHILSRQPMKYRGKEVVREEDWRSMRAKSKYDLILGDLALNVVARNDIPKILRNLSRSLAAGGYCILRTWVRSNDRSYDIQEVVTKHRQKTPQVHFYTACLIPLHFCSYDFKRDNADYPEMIVKLRAACRSRLVKKSEYRFCYDRWKLEGPAFSIPRRSTLEQVQKRYFREAEIKFGMDCFRHWAPIYVLRTPRTVG